MIEKIDRKEIARYFFERNIQNIAKVINNYWKSMIDLMKLSRINDIERIV